MLSWIVIAVLVLIALIALKMNRIRHKTWIILIILLALFLYVSISVVYTKYNLSLNSTGGVFHAGKIYFGWLGNGFQNLKALVGNAVGMDWTSTNGSFFEKNKTESSKTKIK